MTPAISEYKLYNSDGQFQPYTFAQFLNEKHGFVTFEDNDNLYYYKNGYYQRNGKAKVREEYVAAVENGFTKRTMNKVVESLKALTMVKREDFGEPPRYINLKNGVYDLETDQLLDHGPDMEFLSRLPVRYDEDAECQKIKEFVHDIVDDSDVELVQELCGYCLYRGYKLNKAFMLLGEGSNGKTTLLNLLEAFLGKRNVANESLQDLLEDPYSKARLFGKYLNVDADISDNVLKETGNFKKLTGEDTISAHRKYEQAFNFTNHAKLVFAANNLPRTRDDSLGFFRRWILIDFPYTFAENPGDDEKEVDTDILDELTTEEELSGLFNWAVEGLQRVLADEEFSTGGNAEETKNRWIEKADTLAAFIDQYVVEDGGAKVETQEFFEKYSEFCMNRGATPHDERTVGKRIQKLVPRVRKRRIRVEGVRVAHYFNIRIEYKDERSDTEENGEDGVSDKQRVIDVVKRLDEGDGVLYDDLIDSVNLEEGVVEEVVNRLLQNGEAFEPKRDRVKLL